MLNEAILNSIKNKSSDGGLETLVSIIQFYKGNSVIIDLKNIIDLYDSNAPFESIESIISTFDIVPSITTITNTTAAKEHNQPIIINIGTTEKAPHFVVCKNYDSTLGFRIEDSVNGNYYATENGLESIFEGQTLYNF